MFTRGGPEVPQNRGKSMVEKHLERQQQEREEACLVSPSPLHRLSVSIREERRMNVRSCHILALGRPCSCVKRRDRESCRRPNLWPRAGSTEAGVPGRARRSEEDVAGVVRLVRESRRSLPAVTGLSHRYELSLRRRKMTLCPTTRCLRSRNAEEAVVKIREYLREHPNKKRKADSSGASRQSGGTPRRVRAA